VSDFVTPPPPPPPPAMPGSVAAKPGPFGWVAVAAGVLGLLGLVLPWYSPNLSKPIDGRTDLGASYHAWSGFFFLVAAPVLLILFAALWLQALRGQPNSRFAGSTNPTRSLANQSIVAGAIALVLGLLSTVLMTHHYKDWDATAKLVKTAGSTLQKNPQPGLYAVLLGGLLLVAVGIAGLVMPGSPAAPTAAPGAAPAQEGYGAAPGYYPPANPPQG
jgi:hypothetical protein